MNYSRDDHAFTAVIGSWVQGWALGFISLFPLQNLPSRADLFLLRHDCQRLRSEHHGPAGGGGGTWAPGVGSPGHTPPGSVPPGLVTDECTKPLSSPTSFFQPTTCSQERGFGRGVISDLNQLEGDRGGCVTSALAGSHFQRQHMWPRRAMGPPWLSVTASHALLCAHLRVSEAPGTVAVCVMVLFRADKEAWTGDACGLWFWKSSPHSYAVLLTRSSELSSVRICHTSCCRAPLIRLS